LLPFPPNDPPFFSGCCVVFVAVLGKAALGSMQQRQEDKFSRIKSVNQLAATTEVEKKAARWWAVVLSSLVSTVQATLVHHLPLLTCIVLFISGKGNILTGEFFVFV
jgi:hypothetical protein